MFAEEERRAGDANIGPSPSTPTGIRRRTWEEMDALRAQMVREGFPLAELSTAENERVWRSLTQRRRQPQLLVLLGMNAVQLDAALGRLRAQHRALTGRS